MTDQILDIEGNYLIRNDSYSRHTGGVAIYIHNDVTVNPKKM
jgi:hypothetical protein